MQGSLRSTAKWEEGAEWAPWAPFSPWREPAQLPAPTPGRRSSWGHVSRAEGGRPPSLQLNCCGSNALTTVTTSVFKNSLCPSSGNVISNLLKVCGDGWGLPGWGGACLLPHLAATPGGSWAVAGPLGAPAGKGKDTAILGSAVAGVGAALPGGRGQIFAAGRPTGRRVSGPGSRWGSPLNLAWRRPDLPGQPRRGGASQSLECKRAHTAHSPFPCLFKTDVR